jgi:hypothetical protein
MTMVDWKGVGLVEFPEDATPEEIQQVLSDQEFAIDEGFGLSSDPGLWAEIMPDAVERGFRRTVMGVQAARSLNPDLPFIGMSNEEAAIAIREQQARINDIPMSAETSAVLQDVMNQDFFEAVGTMIVNPGAAASIVGEGLGGSVPAAAATIAAVAVPSLMGLALSPFGAAAAGGTAAGATSFATEYANTLISHMMDEGIDVMDVDEVTAALSNDELMAEAKESAVARGIPIGLVDAAAFALGGMFSNIVKTGRGAAKAGVEVGEDSIKVAPAEQISNPRSRAFQLAGMTSMETAGGIGGEALAQLSDEGAINRPGELAIEGLAQGLIGGPTNLVSYLTAEYAARNKAGIESAEGVADLPADQAVNPEQLDLENISRTVAAEKETGAETSNEAVEKLQRRIERTNKKITGLQEKASAEGTTERQAAKILGSQIPSLQQSIAAAQAQIKALAGLNNTIVNEAGDQGIGYGRTPEILELSRRPTKSDPNRVWGFLSSLVSRSTAASERAAQDPNSPNAPVIQNMLNSVKTFFPEVKILKGQRVAELNQIMEPFLQSFRVPALGMLTRAGRGSGGYGINRNISEAMGKALHGPITVDRLRKIMDENNVPENIRPAFVESVQKARAMLDNMLVTEQEAGVDVVGIDDYFPIDMTPLFRGKGYKKRQAAAVDAIVRRTRRNKKQVQDIFKGMEDAFATNKAMSSDLSALIQHGIIPEPTRDQTFQKARTFLPDIRDVLVEEGFVPTDFYEVMRRRIGQHSVAIPSASRIEPIRTQIDVMRKGRLTREESAALDNLMNVTRAVEGRYGTGSGGMSPGAKSIIQPLVTAMYVITLGMAGIASLGEIMVLTGHAKPGDVFYGFRRMIPVMGRKLIRAFKPNLKKSEVEAALEDYLIYVSAPEMAERFTSQSVVDFSSKVTEKFFLANMLTQITQATRIVAAEAFTRAIDRDVGVIKTANKNSKEYRQAMMRMRKLGVPENRVTSMSDEMRQMAILNGIDQTVMTPDPTNRPLWMSNPYLAPVAMLKSFAAVFGNTIGKMVWDELVVGQTAYGEKLTKGERAAKAFKYGTMLSLLMGAQMSIETMRDSIRNWDDEDQDYDDSDSLRLIMNAGKGTMVFGLATPFLDAMNAQQYGTSPTISLLGPVVGKADRLLRAVAAATTDGEIKLLVREAVRSIPFISVNPGARRALEEGILEELNSILN